jgi:hypothetical protein
MIMDTTKSPLSWGETALIKQAYRELFEGKELEKTIRLKYSGKFSDYNANVRYGAGWMEFNLSSKWAAVSDEIKMGLIQSLMQKIFKTKKETINIDLYNKFLKNAHISAPKKENDEVLESSFSRINEKFFNGMMEKPNLEWGNSSHLLGRYEYGSDTIIITKLLEHDYELLDYVMFHEMLHKKHKFVAKKGRTTHHSRQFRVDEKSYPSSEVLEARLKRVIRAKKLVMPVSKRFKWPWL